MDQSLYTVILEPKKRKPISVSNIPPSICHEVMGLQATILVFWMLYFKPAFSLSSSILLKRLFNSIIVVSAYLRLLIFLLAILIPSYDSSTLAFCMMYSARKLNIQPCCTHVPIWNQLVVTYPIWTVASWPPYSCLRRQVKRSGITIPLGILHSLLLST